MGYDTGGNRAPADGIPVGYDPGIVVTEHAKYGGGLTPLLVAKVSDRPVLLVMDWLGQP